MNVEIVTEAAQFPEKEYINGIFLAVHIRPPHAMYRSWRPLLPKLYIYDFYVLTVYATACYEAYLIYLCIHTVKKVGNFPVLKGCH